MIGIAIALLSVPLPVVHLYVSRMPRTRRRVVHILLLYALVLDVGVIGLPLGFIPHVFFADETARAIGWPTGSPGEREMASFHSREAAARCSSATFSAQFNVRLGLLSGPAHPVG